MNTNPLTIHTNVYNERLDEFYQVRKQLKKARFWSILDIFGGGLIMTYMKRRHMKKAMNMMEEVNDQMLSSGIMNTLDRSFTDDQLLTAFDYLADGLAADVLTGRKILKMKESVESLIDAMETMKENA